LGPVRAQKLFHTIVVVGASSAGAVAGCGEAHRSGGMTPDGASVPAGMAVGGAPSAGGSSALGSAAGRSGAGGGPVLDVLDPGAGDPTVSLGGFPGASVPDGEFWPSGCDSPLQYACDGYAPLAGCRCDPNKPRSFDDCGGPRKTRCHATVVDPTADEVPYDPFRGLVDCECVPEDVTAGTDCAGFGQLSCTDGVEWTDCHCDTSAPATPADCDAPWDFFCVENDYNTREFADCSCGPGQGTDPVACQRKVEHEVQCQSADPLFGCLCLYIGIK
jgi:hypothetical protein